MNCIRCQSKYDENKHIPKLLIMCGHTICQKCCSELHKNGKIECIQCRTSTFTDKVGNMPKNLALISDRNANIKHCLKHSKKYEGISFFISAAFCSNEKVLICIQCILQDGHKNHEMNSIPKAYEIELNSLRAKKQKIETYFKSIQQKSEQNFHNQTQFIKIFRQANETVKEVFDSIRQLINEQEVNILKEMETAFETYDQKLGEKAQIYYQKIDQLSKTLDRVRFFQKSSDIDFLDQIRSQQENLNLIKLISYENSKNVSFEHSKQSIFETCIKILTTQKNPVKTTNFSSNPSQLEKCLPKNHKGIFAEPLRGFKKAAFSNISNSQNANKSQKRVSARKESISHHIQAPVIKTIDKDKVLKPANHIRPLSSCQISNEKKTIKKIDAIQSTKSQISSIDARESLCNSFMSNMPSFMGQNQSIYVLGGFNEENNNILKLNLGTMHYKEVAQMNSNRSKFGAIYANKKLYAFGGKRGKERLNDIEAFDFEKNYWTKVGIMNRSRSGFGIILVEDQIYLVGGNDGQNILNTVETFNIKTKEWKKLPSMIEARDELAIAVGTDDKIYAIGGFGGANNQPLRSVEFFDLRVKQWKQLPKMKYARRALSAAVLADGIFAVGGFDGGSYMSSVQKYSFENNQWIQITPMNIARCTHSSIAIYETQQIYVFGGFDFLPLSSVQKYSLITNQWEIMPEMPSARFMHSSALTKSLF